MLSHGDRSGCAEDFSLVLRAHLGIVGSTAAVGTGTVVAAATKMLPPMLLSKTASLGCVYWKD